MYASRYSILPFGLLLLGFFSRAITLSVERVSIMTETVVVVVPIWCHLNLDE